MTTDETIRRAQLVLKDLKDLGLRPAGGILEEWMAHYVAEAIARLEHGETSDALRDQCAATIATLWDLREAQKQRELTSGVNWYLRQSAQLDDADAQRLRGMIELPIPEHENTLQFDAESGVTISQLGKLEEHALSVLWAATSHAQRSSRTNKPSEAPTDAEKDAQRADVFAAMEKPIFRSAQSELAKVFPDFNGLTLEDYPRVSRRVQEVLRALDRVRHKLLDVEIATEPSQLPDLSAMSADVITGDELLVSIDGDEPASEPEEEETRPD